MLNKITTITLAALALAGCSEIEKLTGEEENSASEHVNIAAEAEAEAVKRWSDCSERGNGNMQLSTADERRWIEGRYRTVAELEKGEKEFLAGEIDKDKYKALRYNVKCIPALKPVINKALADNKITLGEYEGDIAAVFKKNFEQHEARKRQRTINELKAAAK